MLGHSGVSLCLATLYFGYWVAGAAVSSSATSATPVATAVPDVVVAEDTTYFNYESVQLTNDSLSQLNESNAALFQFDNSTEADESLRKRSGSCKVFPGDAFWPADFVWSILNLVLGKNALIKTVPLGAPCYAGKYYNAAKCATLYSNWTNSFTQ